MFSQKPAYIRFAIAFAVVAITITIIFGLVESAVINCRCGAKPWSIDDSSSLNPSRQCCEYFVESGEGNFTESTMLCVIENEFIYKRFHSCCVSLIRNAYCFQQKLNNKEFGLNTRSKHYRDPWAQYEKIFGSGLFG